MLWHVMRYYAYFGHTDFILCLGYGASYVKDFFLNYDETRSNDFVLERGDRVAKLFRTDISDWRITFVDTGLHSTIGERLRRVRRFVEDEPMFLANYADVLTNAPLPEMIKRFEASQAAVSLLAVPPQSSHHVVDIGEDGLINGKRQTLVDFGTEDGGDGMTVDVKGNVYVAARSLKRPGILVIDPTGKEVAFIPTGMPDQTGDKLEGIPSNVTFGIGKESKTLYVTVDTSLYRINLLIDGHHSNLPTK